MSEMLTGQPDLKIVVWHGETILGTFTASPEEYSEYVPTYSPVVLRHVLQNEQIRKVLKGYRYSGELTFDAITGADLNELGKLFCALNAGTNYYDRIQLYPAYIEMPGWWIDVWLDDQDITTAYLNMIAHKDINVKFESVYLQDHIPLMELEFKSWGNFQLKFEDLEMMFSELT